MSDSDNRTNDVIRICRNIAFVAFLYLAFTTAYATYNLASGFTDNFWGRLVVVIAMYFLVDKGLGKQGGYFFNFIVNKEERHKNAMLFGFLALIFLARFSASTFFTFLTAAPVAKTLAKEPDTGKDKDAINKAQDNYSARLEALENEMQRLERTEVKRIREAKREGARLVDDAINAGGAGFARLYRENNAWVKTDSKFKKAREKVAAAKVQADGFVFIEKEETRKAQEAYRMALANPDKLAEVISNNVAQKESEYLSEVRSWRAGIWVIDFIAAAISFFMLIVIAIHEKQAGIQYKSGLGAAIARVQDKITSDVIATTENAGLAGWGLVFGGLEKIPVFFKWLSVVVWGKLIGSIEKALRIDIDGDGKIGEPTQPRQPTFQPPTRPTIEGFTLNRQGGLNTRDTSPTQTDISAKTGGHVGGVSGHVGTTPNVGFASEIKNTDKATDTTPPVARKPTQTPPTEKQPTRRKKAKTDKLRTDIQLVCDAARLAIKRSLKNRGNADYEKNAERWVELLKEIGYKVDTTSNVVQFLRLPGRQTISDEDLIKAKAIRRNKKG